MWATRYFQISILTVGGTKDHIMVFEELILRFGYKI